MVAAAGDFTCSRGVGYCLKRSELTCGTPPCCGRYHARLACATDPVGELGWHALSSEGRGWCATPFTSFRACHPPCSTAEHVAQPNT